MVGVGALQPPLYNSLPILTSVPPHTIVSFSLLFPYRAHQLIVSPLLNAPSFASSCTGRRGFCASASEKRRGENGGLMAMEGFDSDDDDDEAEDLPLGYMRKWLENKPPGFGEGKVYDTLLEDKLMEELEQSRLAQLANVNKLKNSPPQSKNGQLLVQKAPELSPSGFHVRVFKLPKKKNVHRDLQSVFKDFPGFINIIPAVSGNKKTRDPICKGFAFVDLKSLEDANRFIQTFSGCSITFGKIQKQIKCEMVNPPTPDATYEQSASGTHSASELAVISDVEVVHPDVDFSSANVSMDSSEEVKPSESHELDDNLVSEKLEEFQENIEHVRVLKISDGDGVKRNADPPTASSSSKQPNKTRTIKKKKIVKKKVEKVPKLRIPGSAVRLKVKEKAVLTDVFSKYGVNNAVSS